MEGLRPCPYCNGEVEMVRLKPTKEERDPIFRIECRRCRRLVARGYSFPIESMTEGEERIQQYMELIKQKLEPIFPRYRKSSRDHSYLSQNS